MEPQETPVSQLPVTGIDDKLTAFAVLTVGEAREE
jgi:hypothetical protein